MFSRKWDKSCGKGLSGQTYSETGYRKGVGQVAFNVLILPVFDG